MKTLNKVLTFVLKIMRKAFAIFMIGFVVWYFQDQLLLVWNVFSDYCADVINFANNSWISFFKEINK